MNKKVCSFPILFALLALLIGTCAAVFPASAQAAPTSTGSITVSGTVASSYDAYQIFSANVVDGDNDAKIATDLAWASDDARDAALPVLHSAGIGLFGGYDKKKGKVLINDPLSGLVWRKASSFERIYNKMGKMAVACSLMDAESECEQITFEA